MCARVCVCVHVRVCRLGKGVAGRRRRRGGIGKGELERVRRGNKRAKGSRGVVRGRRRQREERKERGREEERCR